MKERIYCLDLIKGISIILVLSIHFVMRQGIKQELLAPFWLKGGVPLFIIVSGITHSRSLYSVNHMEKAYGISRILKQITAYSVPFAIFYIYYTIKAGLSGYSFIEWILGFINGGPGMGGYYYPLMIQMVFIFPVIFWTIKKYSKIGLLIFFIINFCYQIVQMSYSIGIETYRLVLFRYIFLLAYGAYFYKQFIDNSQYKIMWSVYSVAFILGLGFIYYVDYSGYTPLFIPDFVDTSYIAGFYWISVFCLIFILGKGIRFRILEYFGRASWHIYLIQMLFWKFYYPDIRDMLSNNFYRYCVSIISCCLIGLFFFHVECYVRCRISNCLHELMISVQKEGLKSR